MGVFANDQQPTFLILLLVMFVGAQAEDPLILTPYLDSNDTSTARQLSVVNITFPDDENFIPSHAGYLTVNDKLGKNMFFWFIPSTKIANAPLLLWLNGGPGVPSSLGLFWENGPLLCKYWFSGIDSLEENPFAWTKFSSVLYVDNPVGTGYSFSERGSDGDTFRQVDITKELFTFLQQFFELFPEYKSREFYIGGQSYAGKYVPSIAHYIDGMRSKNATDIPLTGIFMGGPFFDPPTQWPIRFEYMYSLGVISHATYIKRKALTIDLLASQASGETNMSQSELMKNTYRVPGVDFYDNYVIQQSSGFTCSLLVMNNSLVRNAVHVGNNISLRFRHDYFDKFGSEFHLSTKDKLAELMDKYKVLIYTGDYDAVVTSSMVEAGLLSTPWSRQREYNDTERSVWSDKKGETRGFYSLTGNFCRVVVRGAGHQTPHDQPESSYEMMSKFINEGCVN